MDYYDVIVQVLVAAKDLRFCVFFSSMFCLCAFLLLLSAVVLMLSDEITGYLVSSKSGMKHFSCFAFKVLLKHGSYLCLDGGKEKRKRNLGNFVFLSVWLGGTEKELRQNFQLDSFTARLKGGEIRLFSI